MQTPMICVKNLNNISILLSSPHFPFRVLFTRITTTIPNQTATTFKRRGPGTTILSLSLPLYQVAHAPIIMDRKERIAGGLFVVVLMLLTIVPFNDSVQALANEAGSTEAVRAFAIVFPGLWVGLLFIVLAFTGYEAVKEMG